MEREHEVESGSGPRARVRRWLPFALAVVLPLLGAARGWSACAGDCSPDGAVFVDELVRAVRVRLLMAPVATCEAAERVRDGVVDADELRTAVAVALGGCEAGEQLPDADVPAAAPGVLQNTLDSVGGILDLGFLYSGAGSSSLEARHVLLRGQRRMASFPAPRLGGGDGGGAAVETCSRGGTRDITCVAAGGRSVRTEVYDDCGEPLGELTIRRSGTLRREVPGSLCPLDEVPLGTGFTLTLEDFTQSALVAGVQQLSSFTAELTQQFVPIPPAGCAAQPDGVSSFDGTLRLECEPALDPECSAGFREVELVATGLALQQSSQSSEGACVLTVSVAGGLESSNAATRELVRQTLRGLTLTETPLAGGSAFTVSGRTNVSCLGEVEFDTSVPIRLDDGARCASTGTLDVTRAPEAFGGIIDLPGISPAASAARQPHAGSPRLAGLGGGAANGEAAGVRQLALRSSNGKVYQVVQNRLEDEAAGGALEGAEDVRLTTLVGSASSSTTACFAPDFALAVAATESGAAHPLARVRRAELIEDASAPCFNPNAFGGDGALCLGPGCAADCSCAGDQACRLATVGSSDPIQATLRPASLVPALGAVAGGCSGLSGDSTYAFGASNPTTSVSPCSVEPLDGFNLPGSASALGGDGGSTLVVTYDAPLLTRFVVGAAGFAIDRDGDTPQGCDRAGVVTEGVGDADSIPTSRVQFASGGLLIDAIGTRGTSKPFATCDAPELPVCGIVQPPAARPGSCSPIPVSGATVRRNGRTDDLPLNRASGASCGGGGNLAADFEVRYTAAETGSYRFSTVDSEFDTVLYLRRQSCDGPEIACNDNRAPGDTASELTVELTQGEAVVVVVDGFGRESGAFRLNIDFLGSTAPPTVTPTPIPAPALPDLAVENVGGPPSALRGQEVDVTATVRNQGDGTAGAFDVEFVLSADSTISGDDFRTGFGCFFSQLAPGATATCAGPITIPFSIVPADYRLGAVADIAAALDESNEDNNGAGAPGTIEIGAGGAPPTPTQLGPSPTPTFTRPPGLTRLSLDSGAGNRGERVVIEATFEDGGRDVAGFQTDIHFDSTRFDLSPSDCTIDPRLTAPGLEKVIAASVASAGFVSKRLRIILYSLSNVSPIPSGRAFTCSFAVLPGAASGSVPLQQQNLLASDPSGSSLSLAGVDGEITVLDGVAATPTLTRTRTPLGPTPTFTRTPSVRPTPTFPPFSLPAVEIGFASGDPGSAVDVDIALAQNGNTVTVIAPLRVAYDDQRLTLQSCSSLVSGASLTTLAGPGPALVSMTLVRSTPLPSAAVVRCRFVIRADAPHGVAALVFVQGGTAEEDFNDIDAIGTDGGIRIGPEPPQGEVLVTSTVGRPGTDVFVSVILVNGQERYSSASFDLFFDPSLLTSSDGSCSFFQDPDFGDSRVSTNPALSPPGRHRLRGVHVSLEPIQDGTIAQCRFTLAPGGGAGGTVLLAAGAVVTLEGDEDALEISNGVIGIAP